MSEISQTARVRLIGDGAPAKPAPLAAAVPADPPADAAPPPTERAVGPILLSDSAEGADLLEAARIVQPLAQLCVSGQVQTPFLAAIVGPAAPAKPSR